MNEDDDTLARILAGDGTPEEIAKALADASADPRLARRLADLAAIDAMLGIAAEDEFTRGKKIRDTMDFLRGKEQEDFVIDIRSRLKSRRKWTRGIAAAAAAIALCASGWFYLSSRSVATVVRAETVNWENGMRLEEGSRLKAGSHLHFGSGLLEVSVGKGATMIVEGPADLQLVSTGRSFLNHGRVVIRNQSASGDFQVTTSKGSVRSADNFAISSLTGSDVEVVSLGRDLSFKASDGTVHPVKKDESLFLGGKGSETSERDTTFYTSLPPRRNGEAPFVHWALDEITGDQSPAVSRDMPQIPMELALYGFEGGRPPLPASGRFGAALDFDGNASYAESPFRGIAGGETRTVCFWVKVPQNFSAREGFAVVSWGNFQSTNPGGVWQISINPLIGDGPLGRIRVGTHLGQIVGTSDLRDGQWHHVAVVLYGGLSPDIGTHVLAYLDGEIESISKRTLGPIRTDVEANHGVWIGRNVADTTTAASGHGRFFRGEVDEVYIFRAALEPDEIKHLMDRNELPR